MTSEEFVQGMFENAVASGVESCIRVLEEPPGRKPWKDDVEESNWFNGLTHDDKVFARRCMTKAAEMALFSVFTVLDGVSTIEARGPKGEFRLYFEKDGKSVLLNPPEGKMLHDLMPRSARGG
jgi:hypothetical protein